MPATIRRDKRLRNLRNLRIAAASRTRDRAFLQNNPEVVDGCSGVIAICKGHHVAELSTEELRAILDKLDEVCRQAQELRKQITERMVARARGDRPVSGAASLKERRSRSHKRA